MLAAASVLTALTLAGCSGSGDDDRVGSTNTSVVITTTTQSPVTTQAPSTTSPAPADPTVPVTTAPPTDATPNGTDTPAEAAQGLYDAWQSASPSTALQFASDAAVTQLFAQPGGGMSFYGCQQTAQDLFNCAFRYEGGALHMSVYGDGVSGHKVEEIRFSVD
jgi:hypothetical protein